ncbi:MAG: hypothetical protein ACI8Q1_000378 [Parvicella sp.]|jgi:hypothetical protein
MILIMKKQFFLPLLVTLLLSNWTFAQDKKVAAEYFAIGNFEDALEEYLMLIEEEPDDIEFNYNIAICYLNTNIDKSNAIPYLEKMVEVPKINADAFYLLGRAYHFGYRFDDAIEMYQKFIATGKGNLLNQDNTPEQIAYCENAKELMKFPLNVRFQNLGKNVNSIYSDYYPFVPSDESYLIFNSNRVNQDVPAYENGSFPPSVFMSAVKNGTFGVSQKIKLDVEADRKEIVGLNSAGTKAIYYIEEKFENGNIYESEVKDGALVNPKMLSDNVNSKYVEIAACVTSNDQKLYFASSRPGGYGGVDLYLCQRLPNGDWSTPQNLGATINTESDEDFPNISPDGKTLYFSSKGHAGMGGYDIYKAAWNAEKRKFGQVQNMGYPINTPEDNMNFRVSESGKYGYISAVRSEGLGDLDVYRVDFQDIEPKYTVITGTVSNDKNVKFEDVFIQVADAETDEVFGDYIPNPKTNRYVIILPPGNYNMFVGASGYDEQFEILDIKDKSSFRTEIKKDLIMVSVKEDN